MKKLKINQIIKISSNNYCTRFMEDGHGRAEESLIDIMNCIRDQIVVEWKLFYYAFKKYNQQ